MEKSITEKFNESRNDDKFASVIKTYSEAMQRASAFFIEAGHHFLSNVECGVAVEPRNSIDVTGEIRWVMLRTWLQVEGYTDSHDSMNVYSYENDYDADAICGKIIDFVNGYALKHKEIIKTH